MHPQWIRSGFLMSRQSAIRILICHQEASQPTNDASEHDRGPADGFANDVAEGQGYGCDCTPSRQIARFEVSQCVAEAWLWVHNTELRLGLHFVDCGTHNCWEGKRGVQRSKDARLVRSELCKELLFK